MTADWYTLLELLAVFCYALYVLHLECRHAEDDKRRERVRQNLGRNT